MWRPFVAAPSHDPDARLVLRPDPQWQWTLEADGEPLGSGGDRWFLAAELRYWLVRTAVERAAVPLLHASVVSRDGRALVAMADSGGGKTTLSLALADAGWTYHGDDLAAIDPDTLEVKAYPTPAGIRDPARWGALSGRWEGVAPWHPTGAFLLPAAGLAGGETRPLSVGALAFLDFAPDAAPHFEEVGVGEATLWCTSQMGRRTEEALRTFARLCRATRRVRLRYGSSDAARTLVERLWEDRR